MIFNYSKNVTNNFITLQATGSLLEKYPKIQEKQKNLANAHFEQSLSAKNLSVCFENQKEIHYPDFTIEKGKKYAIVGDSGSGKSTLINILSGQITDYRGALLLDKTEFRMLDMASIRELIALIPQFPYLFRESFQENLTIGRDISPDIFEQSLKIAQAEEFTAQKLTTKFDENLSGGQKERISIARELMGDKPILIMDESTASLDKATALAIERNILQDERLTVLMITHHLYDESRALVDGLIEL